MASSFGKSRSSLSNLTKVSITCGPRGETSEWSVWQFQREAGWPAANDETVLPCPLSGDEGAPARQSPLGREVFQKASPAGSPSVVVVGRQSAIRGRSGAMGDAGLDAKVFPIVEIRREDEHLLVLGDEEPAPSQPLPLGDARTSPALR